MSIADEILSLVQIPSARSSSSPHGPAEAAAASMLASLLAREFPEWRVETDEFAPGRRNVFISGGSESPRILFIGHLDTVEVGGGWTQAPGGTIVQDRIYGRGSADMKSGIVAIVNALRYAHKQGVRDITALFYGDEEYEFAGMKDFIRHYRGKLSPSLVVCPEPSGGKLQRGCRGCLELRVVVTGRAGHAARPASGVSAFRGFCNGTDALERFLSHIPRSNYLGAPTMNVTGVRSGVRDGQGSDLLTAANVIPDYCEATVEVRTIPGVGRDAVVGALRAAVMDAGCTLERSDAVLDLAPFETPSSLIAAAENAMRVAFGSVGYRDPAESGYSDIAMIAADWKVPAVIWGPDGGGMHGPDEYVEVTSVLKLIQGFQHLIDSFHPGE